eukprot:749369-Hanusia_phi.AAC.7
MVASLAVDGPAEQSKKVKEGRRWRVTGRGQVDVRGMSPEDLAQYILGPPGSKVRLGFIRDGSEV